MCVSTMGAVGPRGFPWEAGKGGSARRGESGGVMGATAGTVGAAGVGVWGGTWMLAVRAGAEGGNGAWMKGGQVPLGP